MPTTAATRHLLLTVAATVATTTSTTAVHRVMFSATYLVQLLAGNGMDTESKFGCAF